MLRPKGSFLGSSRAARKANLRAERRKALAHVVRGVYGFVANDVFGTVYDLILLWGLPLLYLCAAYFVLDKPLRWMAGREHFSLASFLIFLGSFVVSLAGIARVVQDAQPVVPVRPKFARIMLGLGWAFALLLTIGDLAA